MLAYVTRPARPDGWATDIDGTIFALEDALDTLDFASRTSNASAAVSAHDLARAIAHLHVLSERPMDAAERATVEKLVRAFGGVA